MSQDQNSITKYDVKDFIEIRNTGKYGSIRCGNMYEPRVREVLGLTKSEHKYIIKNLKALCDNLKVCIETGKEL